VYLFIVISDADNKPSTCSLPVLKEARRDSLWRTRLDNAISMCRTSCTCEDSFSYCCSPAWTVSIMNAVLT